LSLDKWLKPGKKEEVKKKKPEVKQEEVPKKKVDKEEPQPQSRKMTKFILTCPKKSCKYQKIKVKKELTERDKICPRCKGQMKVKED
jgi:hypothetical protein